MNNLFMHDYFVVHD